MTVAVAAILLVVSLIAGWLVFGSRQHQAKIISAAKASEAKGRYREAVLLYGEAVAGFSPDAASCRDAIRRLWNGHGPFEYTAELAAAATRTDIDRDGDLENLKETISIIQQVARGEEGRHSWQQPNKSLERTREG
jgi:hypothetical protein